MATRAGQRKKRAARVALLSEIPSDIASRWELIVDSVAKELQVSRRDLMASIGNRPYKGLPVDDSELQGRWGQIRHDRDALVEVLQANAKFKQDGRVLLPKKLIAGMITQEKKFREGGVD